MFWVSKTLEFPKELETISKIFKGFFPKSLSLMADMISVSISPGPLGSRSSCLQEMWMEFTHWLECQLCICEDT